MHVNTASAGSSRQFIAMNMSAASTRLFRILGRKQGPLSLARQIPLHKRKRGSVDLFIHDEGVSRALPL